VLRPAVLPRSKAHVLRRWAKDVGREAGAGKPLLKTIFQARRLLPRSVAPGCGPGGRRRQAPAKDHLPGTPLAASLCSPLRLVCLGKQVPDLLQHYGTTVRGP